MPPMKAGALLIVLIMVFVKMSFGQINPQDDVFYCNFSVSQDFNKVSTYVSSGVELFVFPRLSFEGGLSLGTSTPYVIMHDEIGAYLNTYQYIFRKSAFAFYSGVGFSYHRVEMYDGGASSIEHANRPYLIGGGGYAFGDNIIHVQVSSAIATKPDFVASIKWARKFRVFPKIKKRKEVRGWEVE